MKRIDFKPYESRLLRLRFMAFRNSAKLAVRNRFDGGDEVYFSQGWDSAFDN